MPVLRKLFLFAGPSLSGSSAVELARRHTFEILPPVRRGDVARLGATLEPGIMVLADGLFHSVLSVSHREIRVAIERGWEIWGISSLGAIRAYEMRSLGMRGFGRVFQMFCDQEDFQDDEVAMLHTANPPYEPITEPLVHLRAATAGLERADLLDPTSAASIIDRMKALWFGDRTLAKFMKETTLRADPAHLEKIRSLLTPFDGWRLKDADLREFFEVAPFCV